jgi:hypothetical protein
MSDVNRTAWAGTMRYRDAVARGWQTPGLAPADFAAGRSTACGLFFRIFAGPNADRKAARDLRGVR